MPEPPPAHELKGSLDRRTLLKRGGLGVGWLGLAGVLGGTAALIAFAIARSLYGGFGSAAPPAVQAYVASRTPRAERT